MDKHSTTPPSSADISGSQHVDSGQALRRLAEEILRKKSANLPVDRDTLSLEEIRNIIQELQVHQIELEMQNQQLRQAQEKLEVSRKRYFDLYDHAPVGYCTLNEKGLIVEANHTAADLLSMSREELINQPVSRFILRDDQDIYYLFRNQFMEVTAPPPGTIETNSEQAGRQQGCDLRMLNKGGAAFFWAHLQGTTAQDSEGTPVYRIVLNDISDRKEAEALRIKFDAKSRRIQTAEGLERMAGSIAHLFNNQLFIVIGNLELALDNGDSGVSPREKLIEALQAAHRSAEVSQLMLTYLGQSNVRLDHVDLSEICRRELPGIKAILPRGVTIRTNLVSPGPVVNANANQIKQILANLIANGSDAIIARSGEGEVKIVIKTVSASDISGSDIFSADLIPFAETFACLEVTDTGSGMSKEEVVKIFDPFYSTKNIGRGLGLAVAKGLLKSWGGMIGVQTAVGMGSMFRVFIPLVSNAVVRPTDVAGKEDFEMRGTVLLVDDDDIVRNLAESVLKHIGFSVISAAGGDEAVVLLKKHRDGIDCLLTDLSMPGLDGWETLAALRSIQPHLPAILCSGYDESQAMSGDHVELPQAFLHKPYTIADLKEVLLRVLGDTIKEIK